MKTQPVKLDKQMNIKSLLNRVSNPFSATKIKRIDEDIPDANLQFLKHMNIQF